jgi:hypothetical protein
MDILTFYPDTVRSRAVRQLTLVATSRAVGCLTTVLRMASIFRLAVPMSSGKCGTWHQGDPYAVSSKSFRIY